MSTGPPGKGKPGTTTSAGPLHKSSAETTTTDSADCIRRPWQTASSQQVSWWSVHEFVAPLLERVGDYPTAGTPAWCELPDDDLRKWVAVLDAGRHHALRMETAQAAMCEASREISAGADWSAIGTELVQLHSFYAARPWLRRAV